MEAFYSRTLHSVLLPLPSIESLERLFTPPKQEAAAPNTPPRVVDYLPELLQARQRIQALEESQEAKAQRASLDMSKLLSQAELHRATVERLEEQNRGLAEDFRNCREQLQRSTEKNHDLEQQLKHLDDACVALQHKFQRSTSRIMELVAQVKSAEERLEVQRQINVGLEDQLGALTRAASNLESLGEFDGRVGRAGMRSGAADAVASANTSVDEGADIVKPAAQARSSSSAAAAAVAARISAIEEDVRNFYAQFPGGSGPEVAPHHPNPSPHPSGGQPTAAATASSEPSGPASGRSFGSRQQSQQVPHRQQQVPPQQQQKRRTDLNYVVVEQLDADLAAKCKHRDEIEAKYRKLENAKIRTVAEKARKDSLEHELSVLNHDISDIRSQLRGMDQLFR